MKEKAKERGRERGQQKKQSKRKSERVTETSRDRESKKEQDRALYPKSRGKLGITHPKHPPASPQVGTTQGRAASGGALAP